MKKIALLIGVSEYEPGLNLLPGASKDVEAMQQILEHPSMGNFDQVKPLINPDLVSMQREIEILFSDCSTGDMVLLYFSGHGVTDDSGLLYFTTRETQKTTKGELLTATTVPASFVKEKMSNSLCKRQVVILDCCFSGAFANGTLLKDTKDAASADHCLVDLKPQLGGEGRAILTSSTAIQYSFFDQQTTDLSIYTHYLVEGIETGGADFDGDGLITVDELHEYAQKKVLATIPTMKPKIYPSEEGYKICIASAPLCDAKLSYRREAERLVRLGAITNKGEFSFLGRQIMAVLRQKLNLPAKEADAIELEVLKPYREYRKKLNQYRDIYQTFVQSRTEMSPATRTCLARLQELLTLRKEDIEQIEAEVAQIYTQGLEHRVQPTLETEVEVASRNALSTQVIQQLLETITVEPLSSQSSKHSSSRQLNQKRKPFRSSAFSITVGGLGSLLFITTGIYLQVYQHFSLPDNIKIELDNLHNKLNKIVTHFYF